MTDISFKSPQHLLPLAILLYTLLPAESANALSVIGDCVSGVENGARKVVTVTLQTTSTERDATTVLINTSSGTSISPQEGSDPKVYTFNNVPEGEWFIQCERCCVLPSPSPSASPTP